MSYKPCQNCLSDELTDAEALAIVREELEKIPATTIAQMALTKDYSPLQAAIKESVKRICVKGAIKQANNVYVWVGGIIAALFILYLMTRK